MERVILKEGKVWVLNDFDNLILRIIVKVHYRNQRRHEYETPLDKITGKNWWPEMKHDIGELTQSCIHCIVSQSRECDIVLFMDQTQPKWFMLTSYKRELRPDVT